jgi:hypothetical protein
VDLAGDMAQVVHVDWPSLINPHGPTAPPPPAMMPRLLAEVRPIIWLHFGGPRTRA